MEERIGFEKEVQLLLGSPKTELEEGRTTRSGGGSPAPSRPPALKCFDCCYKLTSRERKSLGDQVDRIFAERTGITRKLDLNKPEDIPRMEEWRVIARDLVRDTI